MYKKLTDPGFEGLEEDTDKEFDKTATKPDRVFCNEYWTNRMRDASRIKLNRMKRRSIVRAGSIARHCASPALAAEKEVLWKMWIETFRLSGWDNEALSWGVKSHCAYFKLPWNSFLIFWAAKQKVWRGAMLSMRSRGHYGRDKCCPLGAKQGSESV